METLNCFNQCLAITEEGRNSEMGSKMFKQNCVLLALGHVGPLSCPSPSAQICATKMDTDPAPPLPGWDGNFFMMVSGLTCS